MQSVLCPISQRSRLMKGLCIFLFLLISVGPSQVLAAVCELERTEAGGVEEFEIETFNTDYELPALWNNLFGVSPGMSVDDGVVLQAPMDVQWDAGSLVMGGVMTVKVKTDKNDPTIKKVKIEKAGKDDGLTTFISGTGGVNPNVAHGGWHEVEIENMQEVTVTFGNDTVTGILEKLEVELEDGSTTVNPIVKEFKVEIKGKTNAMEIKKGIISSVRVDVPSTSVLALAGVEYEEEIDAHPEILGGHTAAEYEGDDDSLMIGLDLAGLYDGRNDQLEEREGPCSVVPAFGGGQGPLQ